MSECGGVYLFVFVGVATFVDASSLAWRRVDANVMRVSVGLRKDLARIAGGLVYKDECFVWLCVPV